MPFVRIFSKEHVSTDLSGRALVFHASVEMETYSAELDGCTYSDDLLKAYEIWSLDNDPVQPIASSLCSTYLWRRLRRFLKMNIPLVLLPPWRGKVGMGGAGEERLAVPCAALAPLPSPSPVKGEGIEEVESLLEIALERLFDDPS
jgi:hypothetical protein